ncbi:hypothetical protein [Actinoplanes aureus]|uniref:Uncharacterized protein n=1 Tax=Actinoplanes aureus TaxID=2792083 RepID=A0A931G501_9ACTN|nr:hypothetical protein [Actinoplanes aureus]MBG0565784.1 hypothetical protein [Actinoplanes aureus]
MAFPEVFFAHGDGVVRDPAARISSTTRYLSGAAYVDERYADVVVDRFVADSHRAVPPALGYDLTTVIRHCLRARRLWLVQNALVTLILLLGLVVFTAATASLIVAGVCWVLVTSSPAAFRRRAVLAGLALVAGSLVVYFVYSTYYASSSYYAEAESGGGATAFVGGVLLVAGAVLGTLTWSRYRMIMTIADDLARGRPAGPPATQVDEVEQRLRVIDVAQHGNVVLHAGYDPFVSAGERVDAWSLATELRPEEDGEPLLNGNGRPVGVRYVPIDPVELVTHLRRRLAGLRSRDLPEHERITGLQLRDLVISSGTRWRGFPLIDEGCRLPYSYAAPEAVEGIIRAPQTGGRHFLRASVGAAEKAAVDGAGHTIMPAEHQSIVTSTFLHVAVEGGMLYVELVSTVLGPIQQRYLDIDAYDRGDRRTAALREAAARLVPAIGAAPARLVRSIWKTVTLRGAILRSDRAAAEEAVHDFGAHWDVRELASRAGFANYLQRLDAEKYRRLIDRRATEAIYEFLSASGVDTSDFAAKVNFHQYTSATIHGDVHGPVAVGDGAVANSVRIAAQRGSAVKGAV